ncbi:YidH family protein [Candidatus Rhabdochlamydia porcellionis]|jgi:uncharacterized membrane protein YidH (DUF202 family)|uniref:DUF202 domain-containing protein n=1 Tax=Candidatus Rhabdochlamydia porcellionis TaxID=225148 RepID=A0ABX8Z437_9BACT|nr:DUF202 domain-containing protein [Candidatus Rhabdochlamydia porcellionis]QZA58841.1 protein of unknown function (DUF202) [Candidatus Rhabdochlamydia porcellionis]
MIEKHSEKPAKIFNRADHLANERTFLAWIRTNLGIMAFGFVVGRFSFFTQQIASFLEEQRPSHLTLRGYSSLFGISLVSFGAMLCIFAFFKFKKTERQINNDVYQSSTWLNALLALFVFSIGIFLVVYLLYSHEAYLTS